MISKRVISATVLIPVVGLVIYLGGWVMLGALVLVGLAATYEYVTMLRTRGNPSYLLPMAFATLLVADGYWAELGLARWGMLIFPMGILIVQIFRGNRPGSIHDWALTVSGAIYIGYALSFFIRLRGLEQGMNWIIVAFLGTWICDSGAYFVGSTMGKRKLCPLISPKKTWEGAVGGLISGVLAVVLLGWWLLGLPIGWGVLLGIALVLAATFGDLAESVIKRQLGVKDSGNLIPGHGGMLDRIDSLLYVVPTVYAASQLLVHLVA